MRKQQQIDYLTDRVASLEKAAFRAALHKEAAEAEAAALRESSAKIQANIRAMTKTIGEQFQASLNARDIARLNLRGAAELKRLGVDGGHVEQVITPEQARATGREVLEQINQRGPDLSGVRGGIVPCPTCSGPTTRETTDMVCQTCGRDYDVDRAAAWAAHREQSTDYRVRTAYIPVAAKAFRAGWNAAHQDRDLTTESLPRALVVTPDGEQAEVTALINDHCVAASIELTVLGAQQVTNPSFRGSHYDVVVMHPSIGHSDFDHEVRCHAFISSKGSKLHSGEIQTLANRIRSALDS